MTTSMTYEEASALEAPWMKLAEAELGVKEAPGYANNPIVQGYFADSAVTIGAGKTPDSVPWCAAFVGAMLKRSWYKGTNLWAARSYLHLKGAEILREPRFGCIVVFRRGNDPWAGHVAFYVKDVGNKIQVLGGNQADEVCYQNYPKARVVGYRWPTVRRPMPLDPKQKGSS